MAPSSKPYQLLEINIISAQDLEPVSKKMRTYAKAWVHTNRKLLSCVDNEGSVNPTWNDKFVFRVNEEFLQEDTSAVMIEIYATHWFRDVIVGTVRVLVGNLIPPPARSRQNHIGMRFVALQVRRPSGRPQGILNIGVALLDGSLRSMPLYTLAASAVGYRDLMQDPASFQQLQQNNDDDNNDNQAPKPILRRSRSERSGVNFENFTPSSSMVGVPTGKMGVKDGSIIAFSESMDLFNGIKKTGKASSVINGAELRKKPKQKGKKGKASSVVNAPIFSKGSSNLYKYEKPNLRNEDKTNKGDEKPGSNELSEKPTTKVVDEKSLIKVKGDASKEKAPIPTSGKHVTRYNGYNDYGAPKGLTKGKYIPYKGNSILSGSEVGPSPSEVAAMMAERRYPLDDNQSSVLDGWSLDESVEGLRSKLERWRTELPPLYDHGFSSSSYKSSYKSSSHHGRRHSDNGSGLFSCFGNICGYECQCVCGQPPRRTLSSKFIGSSVGSPGRSFI